MVVRVDVPIVIIRAGAVTSGRNVGVAIIERIERDGHIVRVAGAIGGKEDRLAIAAVIALGILKLATDDAEVVAVAMYVKRA